MEDITKKILGNILGGKKPKVLEGKYKKGKKLMEEEYEEEDEGEGD